MELTLRQSEVLQRLKDQAEEAKGARTLGTIDVGTGKYEPAPFQVEDLGSLVNREYSANWSEMGCYKTTTAAWLIQQKLRHIKNPRVLVITTKSGKGAYFRDFPEVLPNWGIINISTTKVQRVLFGREFQIEDFPQENNVAMVAVTHYNVFTQRKARKKALEEGEAEPTPKERMLDKLLRSKWDMVILDEAHRIKEPKVQWTINIKKIKAPYRHVMTGTGFINNPAEVWSLLNFLAPAVFRSYWRFREYYCSEIMVGGFRKIVGPDPEHKEEFRTLVRSLGPRRLRQEEFKDLKEPIFSPVDVDLSPVQRQMYDQIKNELYTLDQAGVPLHAPNVLAALSRLRQVCVATPRVVREYYDETAERLRTEIVLEEPSSKLDALMEIIDGLEWDEERRDQVVVFSNFRDPIELAKARFEKKGISYIHMQQSDNDQKRYMKWAHEFPKKEHQVFICTLQLGSESISLTSATTCVFLDRSWSPKDNEQGISRIYRPPQQGVPNIIHVNARNTTDQRIARTNQIKQGWFQEIFGDG